MMKDAASKALAWLKPQATVPNFLGLLSVALLIIVYLDVLMQRYREFSGWASSTLGPLVEPLAQVAAIVAIVVTVTALALVLARFIDSVYFSNVRRIATLEEEITTLRERLDALQATSVTIQEVGEVSARSVGRDDELAGMINGIGVAVVDLLRAVQPIISVPLSILTHLAIGDVSKGVIASTDDDVSRRTTIDKIRSLVESKH